MRSTWENISKTRAQHVDGDAQAVVTNRHHGFVADLTAGEPDRTALFGVLGRIVEQVGDYLGQPHRIGLHHERPRWEADRQLVQTGVDERPARLDGGAHDGAQVNSLLASSILPRVMRDTSNRSSTRRTMWLTWRSIIS